MGAGMSQKVVFEFVFKRGGEPSGKTDVRHIIFLLIATLIWSSAMDLPIRAAPDSAHSNVRTGGNKKPPVQPSKLGRRLPAWDT